MHHTMHLLNAPALLYYVQCTQSHLVISELDRCEEVDGYLEEIAQLTDDKSHVARMINYGKMT